VLLVQQRLFPANLQKYNSPPNIAPQFYVPPQKNKKTVAPQRNTAN
jgi:hypothetical protein